MEQFSIRTIFISAVSQGEVEYRFHGSFVDLYKERILFVKVNVAILVLLSKTSEVDSTFFID